MVALGGWGGKVKQLTVSCEFCLSFSETFICPYLALSCSCVRNSDRSERMAEVPELAILSGSHQTLSLKGGNFASSYLISFLASLGNFNCHTVLSKFFTNK